MTRHLSIDIETFSGTDIKKSGLYKYVEAADFQILLFACSFDGGPIRIIDLAQGEALPGEIVAALQDPQVVKHAYNAAFEWYCLNKFYVSPLEQWQCTMLHGLYCGYTAGLAATAAAMGLPQDKQKMSAGSALIRTFCVPCKPSNANGGRMRTYPNHEPERWALFKDYCVQDVAVEMEIERRLSGFPVPEQEQKLWQLDQQINARGVAVDLGLVRGALYCNDAVTKELDSEAKALTGLDNPGSVAQLSAWLAEEGVDGVTDLRKETVSGLITSVNNDKVRRVLELRQATSKTSVKKYDAIESVVCHDSRVRGLLQFYGGNRTGRWAGRLVQVHNLPRNYLKGLPLARECVKARKVDALKILYGSVPDTLSQLIRTAFVPRKGCTFLIADFSAIEARVIAWLAGEQWVNEVFASHGKIYEATASQMFGVPIDKIVKGNPEYELRQKGKVATLALGYQGGVHALESQGALRMGLAEDELKPLVDAWRAANKRIVDLWYKVEQAAVETMRTGRQTGVRGLIFAREGDCGHGQDFFTIALPGGRKLFYARPFLTPNEWGKEALHYHGTNQTTRKWEISSTYGGKIVENCVQAIARDCLAVCMTRLADAGYQTVMHIHDEVVLEVPKDAASLDPVIEIMRQPIPWAPGLILNADGFISEYYKKE